MENHIYNFRWWLAENLLEIAFWIMPEGDTKEGLFDALERYADSVLEGKE